MKELIRKLKKKTRRRSLQLYLFPIVIKRFLVDRRKNHVPEKSVWLDLNDDYERYSYILSKYFEIEGYQVYVKANWRFLSKLTDGYSKKLITENQIIFLKRKPDSISAQFSDRNRSGKNGKTLSRDYFSTIFDEDSMSYHIPIGLHPKMYSTGLWNEATRPVEKRQSVFFAGNFDGDLYNKMHVDQKFKMPDRIQIKEMLESLPNATFPKTYNELIKNIKDGQIDIVQKRNFQIPQELLRQTIAKYYFFIACPGVLMPLSHNIFEAMSVGTIPIIHWQYARMFHPPLEDLENAILYDNDFLEKIEEALNIGIEQIKTMESAVIKYYETYLTPKAIVENLLRPDVKICFLNAEGASVSMMK